jgi:stalled ribosome alternative rescue factor ArfA
MHIILVGASHGWRLFRALKRIPGYGTTFKVTCLCVRGAKFVDLFWPQTVKESDFLVVIPFGNDLHPRKFVRFDGYLKVFHLDKFVPYTEEYWNILFTKLHERLSDKNCKIIVIDNFYRHFCCDAHKHKGCLRYQTKINKNIQKYFENSSVKVVDHVLLLENPRIIKRNHLEYRKLQCDSVHFRDYFANCKELAKNALKKKNLKFFRFFGKSYCATGRELCPD